ncbi:MAG: GTPase [archaeon]|nr:MAG: GTPase [archaeon]
MVRKVIIMGAAGRDFHDFNVLFRNNPSYEVVAFTATQIPEIDWRTYPRELAGRLYPKGIKIHPEWELPKLIREKDVDEVIFSYSDVSYKYLMERASLVLSCGADFRLLTHRSTALKSKKPVISVCAVRTGCGKSQTTRRVCEILRTYSIKFTVIRHPMPYGNFKNPVQRFSRYSDLKKYNCTIEEREEYEPHLEQGNVVYAGVDYARILKKAEKESQVIVWEGGNNDFPFLRTDLHIVVTDPHRAGHERDYHPGAANLRMADLVVINKEDTALKKDIEKVQKNIKKVNPKAKIIHAESPIYLEDPELVRKKKVLVIEDGPTLTHGGMHYGAGYIAARHFTKKIIDPRPYAKGSLKETFEKYVHLAEVLPAMGYNWTQMKELEDTINSTPSDAVVVGTPIDLARFLDIKKPHTRVFYKLKEKGKTNLKTEIRGFLKKRKLVE